MEDINCWEEKFEVCEYAARLLDKVAYLNKSAHHPIDIREIKKGIYYARKYHGTQMRQSGDPYYSHPIEVAYLLAEYTAIEVPKLFIPSMLNAALLHDTIEDTSLTEENIAIIFDRITATHVEGLTRVKPYGKITAAESLKLLIQQKRYNVGLIKVFDRIHNLQTLEAKSLEKAKKIIQETIKSFIPFTIYLGITQIEEKLTELCYKHLSLNAQKNYNIISKNNFQLDAPTFQNDLPRTYIL
ncbi:HD domain-containing protein [Rickettsia endosymbiont of Halotydeus destructor]|uniref:HD domain-containing protein n=1 Tax=Rickettsia endosymbiont of Halotydeus destructor TaxID=2996754 RepID=UPI003BB118BE